MLVPSGEKVTIVNKIGAYFHIDVPHSLEIYNVIFDGLDSLGTWNAACLGSHTRICQLDASTKSVSDASSSGLTCICAKPPLQSLNNCVSPLPTSLIKLDYKSASYSTPKSILIQNSEFHNFFYSLNALIDIAGGPGLLTIINSVFQKFSICGAIVKNQNDVYVGKRNTGSLASPTYTQLSEDTDQKRIEDEAIYSYSSQVSNCNSPQSDSSYGQKCAFINVEGSSFRDFDYFFSTELSLSGTTSGLAEDYDSSKTNRLRASIFHLKDYSGFVRVTRSTFENTFLKRNECYYNTSKGYFDVNVSRQNTHLKTFSALEDLKIENPIIITNNRHGILVKDNVVKGASGSKGFLYGTLAQGNLNVTLIHNNTFLNVAGFQGSAAIHFSLFESSFSIDNTYSKTCGGLTIRNNTFENCFGCNSTSPIIRVDCAVSDSASSYKTYQFETSLLTPWTSTVAQFTDSLVSLQYGSDVESDLSARGVVFDGNSFTKIHRGSNSEVILVNHIPAVTISNTKIQLSSSFKHLDQQNSQLQTSYLAAFGNKTLLPRYNSSNFSDPSSLLKVSQGLWITIKNFNATSNLIGDTSSSFGVMTLYEPQFTVSMDTLIFDALESSNCSLTYKAIYNQACSTVSSGSVGIPLIYLSESVSGTNTFTPTFQIQNIDLSNLTYSRSGSNEELLLKAATHKAKQQDFQIYKARVTNVQSVSNSLFTWRGQRLTIKELEVAQSQFQFIVTSSVSANSLSHSLVLEDVKLIQSVCETCFNVENLNVYEFSLKNKNTALFYFDLLNITSYFLNVKSTSNNAVGTHSLQNITLTNIRRTSQASMVILYSNKPGSFNLTNLHFYQRPALDGGWFLYFSAGAAITVTSQNLVLYNVDGSATPGSLSSIYLVGFNLAVTFLNNNITGHRQQIANGTIGARGSAVTDSFPHYESNKCDQGAVYMLSLPIARVSISNGVFVGNEATVRGGAIFHQQGQLNIRNTNFTMNKANALGGVYSNTGGRLFIFTDCIFVENTSGYGSVIHSMSGLFPYDNLLENCLFKENKASKYGTMQFIYGQVRMKNITLQNNYGSYKNEGIVAIYARLSIQDSLFSNSTPSNPQENKYLEGSLFYISEESIVDILRTTFTGGKAIRGGGIMVQGQCTVLIDNCTFYNNSAIDFGGDIYGISYYSLQIVNSSFSHSTSSIALFQAGERAILENNRFSSYITTYPVIYARQAMIQFKNNTIKGYVGLTNSVFEASNMNECLIESSSFQDIIAQHAVKYISTAPSLNQTLHLITNSSFMNIQANQDGAAVALYNINAVIQNSTFISCNNTQFNKRGGAIFVTETSLSTVKIQFNSFQTCSAYLGGAIAFANYQPEIRDNLYSSNSALLSGSNIASYPQSIKIISDSEYQQISSRISLLESSASTRNKIDTTALQTQISSNKAQFLAGQRQLLLNDTLQSSVLPIRDLQTSTVTMKSGATANNIYVGLLDNYNQIVPDLDFSSPIILSARIEKASSSNFTGILSNFTQITHTHGLFAVQGVGITAEPGTTLSLVFTASFDTTKNLSINSITQATQSIALEKCASGEAFLQTGQCEKCKSGQYLLKAPTSITHCEICKENALCFGGDKIGPKPGYWRSSNTSVNFIQCFNQKACLGATDDSNYDPSGTCQNGYHGILCAQCDPNFVRNSSFQCAGCPPVWQNVLLVILAALVVIAVIVVLVKITLRSQKHRKSPFSAYMKIMMNHLHLVFLTASFNLRWPGLIQDFFNSAEPVANVGDRIISIDCFLDTAGFSQISRPYVYMLIYLFLPLGVVIMSLMIWGIIHRGKRTIICNRAMTTIIIILFLLHPSITTLLLRVFHCYEIDRKYHLVRDLSKRCWTTNHLTWALVGAFPGFLIWGIGIPLTALLSLYYVRLNLDEDYILQKYGFLYNGYKRRNYYWESVIMFRKVAMIFITVFLSSLGRIVQALAVIVLLVFYLFITLKKKPYTTRRLNDLEINSLLTSSITIYCGVFFLTSRDANDPSFTPNVHMTLSQETRWILVVTIFLSNTAFLYYWLYFFCQDVKLRFAQKSLKCFKACCLCCRYSRVQRSKLLVLKNEQDIEIVNEIENLEAQINLIKDKYLWHNKFREKWKFEDFLRRTLRELGELDHTRMKLKDYRHIHSLEGSQLRGEKKEEEYLQYEEEMERQRVQGLRRRAHIMPDEIKLQIRQSFAETSPMKKEGTIQELEK